MALLVTGRTAPSLSWADETPALKAGDKVYLLGGHDGGPATGVVSNVSPTVIQHNVLVDERRQGAPLLNEKGQILGMVSLAPTLGAVPGAITYVAVPIATACDRVLSCGGGTTVVAPTGINATTTTTTRG
jgi:hypothetical protein